MCHVKYHKSTGCGSYSIEQSAYTHTHLYTLVLEEAIKIVARDSFFLSSPLSSSLSLSLSSSEAGLLVLKRSKVTWFQEN